jgi:hypothetical protein
VAWIGLNSERAEVFTAFSDDGARNWSRPKTINEDEPLDPQQPWRGPHHDYPALATNADGVLAVLWYDRRDARRRGYTPRVSASLDGGETWTASVPLTPAPVADGERFTVSTDYLSPHDAPDGRSAVSIRFGPFEKWAIGTGDTAGLAAAADGRFHAVWIDDRTGVDQVWTRSFTVEGRIRRMQDVTDQARPEVVDYVVDPSNGHVSLDMRILNVSAEPLALPLTIEFVAPTSPARSVHALNADNTRSSVGAIWTFTGEQGSTLPPGQATLTRPVRIAYRDTGPELWSLAGIGIRVLAPVTP